MSTYDLPPVGGRWKLANALAEPFNAGRDLSEKPTNIGGKQVKEDSAKRAELERRFGLPLTRLSDAEWSRVKTAAAKTASEKLHIPFSKAASHYEAFVPEGYAEAITRKEGTSKGANGAPGKKTTNPTLADESWMSPGIVDLSESSAEDRDFIKRAEAYAFEHCMSWNEATRYVTR